MAINQHQLSKNVVLIEGGKKSLSIAQVKEVIRITLGELANQYSEAEVLALLKKHRHINEPE